MRSFSAAQRTFSAALQVGSHRHCRADRCNWLQKTTPHSALLTPNYLAIEGSEVSVMVLICVGAQLPFLVSSYLLERGGYGFRPGNMDDHWYAYVLMYKYADPVDEVNAFLREQGATPLF